VQVYVCDKERETERKQRGVPNISDVPFRRALTTQDALEAT
jgi:hypothetical protein